MILLTQHEWDRTTREAVDIALLSRLCERYADHWTSM